MPQNDSTLKFHSILGQNQPVSLLSKIIINKNIPHALLFTGTDGIGKKSCAIIFAMAFNCINNEIKTKAIIEPCGKCPTCKKIITNNHPDIFIVEPNNSIISVSQIRDISHLLSMKPYEAKTRFTIISDANLMNQQASNALLKELEEPPENSVIIITTSKKSDLLTTILSRCQEIKFNSIQNKDLVYFLKNKFDIKRAKADIISSMAYGSIAKAVLINNNNLIDIRNWLINFFSLTLINHSTISYISILAFAEKLINFKEILDDLLEIIKLYLRDILIFRYSCKKIVNKDFTESICKASKILKAEDILNMYGLIQKTQNNIIKNFNAKLCIESMLFQIYNA